MVDQTELPEWDDEERAALVALLRVRPGRQGQPRQSQAEVLLDVLTAGRPSAVWERWFPVSLFSELSGDDGVPDDAQQALTDASRRIAAWRRAGLDFHTIGDSSYPSRLRAAKDAPPILFSRGKVVPESIAVAVVGARKAGLFGRGFADELATELARRSMTVVSGLSAGADGIAHRSALTAGGRTVAVLGTGIRQVHPAQNRKLQEDVATAGLVLSQFWPDDPPDRHTFDARKATISGYSDVVVVVDADEASGVQAQAWWALEQRRPVILTARVVDATEWGHELTGHPRVSVASSVDETLAMVPEVIGEPVAGGV